MKSAGAGGERGEEARPYDVRVAEALGWPCRLYQQTWICRRPGEAYEDYVPVFSQSWKEVGPLIQRHRISLDYFAKRDEYIARSVDGKFVGCGGRGPYSATVAVCELVLEMKEAGVWV